MFPFFVKMALIYYVPVAQWIQRRPPEPEIARSTRAGDANTGGWSLGASYW